MQEITPYDLSFYEYSMIADDPDKLEQLQNHYYDPEFDDWLEEFDREQEEKAAKLKQEKQYTDYVEPQEESQTEVPESDFEEDTDYEISEPVGIDEWEEVD